MLVLICLISIRDERHKKVIKKFKYLSVVREVQNKIKIFKKLTSSTPIFRQASRKLSTFLRRRAMVSAGCAGEGTCTEATARGRTWLARWHSTTPSASTPASCSGSDIFSRDSIICALPKRSAYVLLTNDRY